MESTEIVKEVVLANQETYSYREIGDSETVLIMLHGAAYSSRIFSTYMAQLSKILRVVAIDFRGHGLSSYKQTLASLDDLIEDLKQFVDALGFKKFFLLGWSLGGDVAMKFSGLYSDLVQGLILLNTDGAKGYPALIIDASGARVRAKTKEEADNSLGVKMMKATIASQDRETVRNAMIKNYFNGKHDISEERLNIFVDEWLRCKCADVLAYICNIFNITDEDNGITKGSNEISKITSPALIIHGENDHLVPIEEAKYIQEKVRGNAILEILKETGHFVIEEHPQEVLKLIENFCSPK